MKTRHCQMLAWLLLAKLLLCDTVLAEHATTKFDELTAQAQARQDSIKNVWVEYDVKYDFLTDKSSVRDRYTLRDYSYTFALMGERRLSRMRGGMSIEWNQLTIFDGEYSLSQSTDDSASLVSGKQRSCEDFETYCRLALQIAYKDSERAFANGDWYFPESIRQGKAIDKNFYYLCDEEQTVDGASCVVFEHKLTDNVIRDRVFVDMSLGGAIRRRIRSDEYNGKLYRLESYDLSEYVKTDCGVWVPKRVVVTRYGLPMDGDDLLDKPIERETITVSKIRVNDLTDDDFAYHLKPGTLVHMRTNTYLVPGGSEAVLHNFVDVAKKTLARQAPPKTPPASQIRWLIIGNIGVLAVIALALWLRRNKISSDLQGS